MPAGRECLPGSEKIINFFPRLKTPGGFIIERDSGVLEFSGDMLCGPHFIRLHGSENQRVWEVFHKRGGLKNILITRVMGFAGVCVRECWDFGWI